LRRPRCLRRKAAVHLTFLPSLELNVRVISNVADFAHSM
jgi:hypothetical protein